MVQQPLPPPIGLPNFAQPRKVFIVHGRNHGIRDSIDLYLTKDLKLKTEVMEAGAHEGRTLVEKFEAMAGQCSFAIFIVTLDDMLSEPATGRTIKRPRQNVILEIGYFWGKLGRQRRVAFLMEEDPNRDLPSDIEGIGWIPITPDLALTKERLRQELRAAQLIK